MAKTYESANATSEQTPINPLGMTAFIIGVLGIFAAATYWIYRAAEAVSIVYKTERHLRENLALSAGVLVAGWLLFALRSKAKAFYGLLEIAFALVSAFMWLSRGGHDDSAEIVLFLAAASYLVVRGMVNFRKAT